MPATDTERIEYSTHIEDICDELLSWNTPTRADFMRNIKKLFWSLGTTPIPVRSDWDQNGAKSVRKALDMKPDVVVFDFPHSVILAPNRIPASSVMFTHNVEAEIFRRHWQVARSPLRKWIWKSQFQKMSAFEKTVLGRFDSVIAVSDRDRQFFRADYSIEHCRTIPTGVDTDYFRYTCPENNQQVVFCGSMDWMANIDGIEFFYEEIWPLIHRKAPSARMKVVGRAPDKQLVSRICKASREWEFTGYVDDVRKHIRGAAAFVIPLRVGGGTRIKAFEAMAMGAPVVSTGIGIEGLPVENGQHYLAADYPQAFANSVLMLLENSVLREKISVSARDLVLKHYSYRRAAAVFEDICIETMNRQQP